MKNIFQIGDIVTPTKIHTRMTQGLKMKIVEIHELTDIDCNFWQRPSECISCDRKARICTAAQVDNDNDNVYYDIDYQITNCDVMYSCINTKPNITEFGKFINSIYEKIKKDK